MSTTYQTHLRGRRRLATSTPQRLPIPGREAEMLPNNAGGWGFKLDLWESLNRFLILGSEGGTYYVGEAALTAQNVRVVEAAVAADGPRAVRAAQTVNLDNRAPKVSPSLLVLATALSMGSPSTQAAARAAIPGMLRTGSHFLEFVSYLNDLGGWGPAKIKAARIWLTTQSTDRLAFQMLKYQQRNGWAMRDALRLLHPPAATPDRASLFDWACGRRGEERLGSCPGPIQYFEQMLAMEGTASQKALWGIQNGLPREALPTEALTDREVWQTLLPITPPHALLRNLGRLAAGDLLDKDGVRLVTDRLRDTDWLRRARVHPFALILAALVYGSGKGVRSGKSWTPDRRILEALDDAFENAFAWANPIHGRHLISKDISGSMGMPAFSGGQVNDSPVTAASAASAMAIVLARLSPDSLVIDFSDSYSQVEVRNVTRRTTVRSLTSTPGGGTDLSVPMRWAGNEQRGPGGDPFDSFILLTDNETWAGNRHPTQALGNYREAKNPAAKLVCCSMAANHANIVDSTDPLQLGCAGLDANLPSIVSDFLMGSGEGEGS